MRSVRVLTVLTRRLWPSRAVDEFVLSTVLLFLAVTVVRWLRDPGSALRVADPDVAIVVIAALGGTVLTALILSPPGRRSGGHMNPAVTVSLWLMGVFPGRGVLPYVLAQLAGSAAGTGLARLVWGRPVSGPGVGWAALGPGPGWQPPAVLLAEVGGMAAIVLAVGFVLAHDRLARLLPYAVGLSVALVIALLGTRSGGSVNPARQLGPALLAGHTEDLWIYLLAPILGAALGAGLDRILGRLPGRRRLPAAAPRTAGVPRTVSAPRTAEGADGSYESNGPVLVAAGCGRVVREQWPRPRRGAGAGPAGGRGCGPVAGSRRRPGRRPRMRSSPAPSAAPRIGA
ncbi:hypothetical protein EAO69_43645, partial [Streptomyces sp. me109]